MLCAGGRGNSLQHGGGLSAPWGLASAQPWTVDRGSSGKGIERKRPTRLRGVPRRWSTWRVQGWPLTPPGWWGRRQSGKSR